MGDFEKTDINNKKFLEEIINYLSLMRRGPLRKRKIREWTQTHRFPDTKVIFKPRFIFKKFGKLG
jgi:hypothetical protein